MKRYTYLISGPYCVASHEKALARVGALPGL
jgi:hypothetical protein